MFRGRRRSLVPEARMVLDQLKFQVVREVGVAQRPHTGAEAAHPAVYYRTLDHFKWQIAEELGLDRKVRALGWADMPSRECGAIGGRVGGQIGGRMVRHMIALAEERIATSTASAPAGPPLGAPPAAFITGPYGFQRALLPFRRG